MYCLPARRLRSPANPGADFPDVLAERLAISKVGGARENIDLCAGVVDVIFSDNVIAREYQKVCQRIAEHRAAAMPDMHRPGRIGGNVFDIDLLARVHRASPIGRALAQHCTQRFRPGRCLQGEIDEAGTGNIDGGDQIVRAQPGCDLFGEVAGFCLGLPGQHHRGVGRHIAVRRIARRLDHDARQVNAGGPPAFRRQRAADRVDTRKYVGEKMLR